MESSMGPVPSGFRNFRKTARVCQVRTGLTQCAHPLRFSPHSLFLMVEMRKKETERQNKRWAKTEMWKWWFFFLVAGGGRRVVFTCSPPFLTPGRNFFPSNFSIVKSFRSKIAQPLGAGKFRVSFSLFGF